MHENENTMHENTTTRFFPVDWTSGDSADESDPHFRIVAFGKTPDGSDACCRVRFTPCFFVKAPEGWSESRVKLWASELCQDHGALRHASRHTKRRSAWGFTNGSSSWFVQLAFSTLEEMRRARSRLRREKRETFEASVEPLIRLFHACKLSPAGWIDVTKSWEPRDRISRADVEIETSFEHVRPHAGSHPPPPLVIASWDIECYSETGEFPLPTKKNDYVIQISTAFQRYGDSEPYLRSVVCLRDTEAVDGVEIVSVDTEDQVIERWMDVLQRERVDVLVGWNVWQFDWKYVEGRGMVCVDDATAEPLVDLSRLGKLREGGGRVTESELNSSAYGENKFFYLETPGILQIDLMQWFKKNRNLESYSLQNVSKLFLGNHKLDLPASEIFRKFTCTPADRADIAKYAVRDTELPLQLMTKMSILQELFEMANAVRVPVGYLNLRGQQIRVFSALVGKARERGFVIPDDKSMPATEMFEGATVLEPKKGAYYEPIAALDFASLYPSIIRAENLSFDTIVLDKRFRDVPGVEYVDIETGLGTFRYAQPGDDNRFRGILPDLLDDLAKFRKQAKRDMAEAKKRGDEWQAALFDKKQAAYKVTMNSAYGFFGASKGFLPVVPIAASVTATGRRMIAETSRMATELVPGSEVVYGDSVAGYTPVIVRTRDGMTRIAAIEDLAASPDAWKPCHPEDDDDDAKEYCALDLECWTDAGWTEVRRVMRHRAGKSMYRVVTSHGCVDVTKDHSLLLEDGTPATPMDVQIGTGILHHEFPEVTCANPMTDAAVAFNTGTFFAAVHSDIRPLYAHEGDDLVPTRILGAGPEVRRAFWDGVWAAQQEQIIGMRSQVGATRFMMLAASLGIATTLDVHDHLGDDASYHVSVSGSEIGNAGVVSKRKLLHSNNDYVYDLTTDNHHFAAGAGRIVVHNTDSVMVRFNIPDKHDMNEQFAVATRVAETISKTFKPPHELEMEKIYVPYVLYAKKRYAAIKYESPSEPGKRDVKGLALVRRDNCELLRDVLGDCLDAILGERDATGALDVARRHVLGILEGSYPLDKFVISKTLRNDYKVDAQPHVYVARKILQRRGYPVPSGTRVPYVFVQDRDEPDKKQASKAEDPEYAREHGLAIDTLYYIDHQFIKPLKSLFDPIVDDPEAEIFGHPSIKPYIDELSTTFSKDLKVAKRVRKNKANKQHEITSFFKP